MIQPVYKMDPEKKRVWVAELRSGNHRQGKHKLMQQVAGEPTMYCCLGVLAKVTGLLTEKQLFYNEGYDQLHVVLGVPPYGVSNRTTCIHMNDTEGKSFAEIADWVEKNL